MEDATHSAAPGERSDRQHRRRRDRGQSAVIVLAMVTAIGAGLCWAAVDLGRAVGDRGRAQTAADAAALAATAGDRGAAARLAAANGARLVAWSFEASTSTVTVTVRVGDATARARATAAP